MTRPPLANLLAFFDEDPGVVDAVAVHVERSSEFAQVRRRDGWVVAISPLPGSEAGPPKGELVFAEGRDGLEGLEHEAAALARDQPQRLSSLPGDFGFVALGPQGSCTVVRSCGGLVPFHVRSGASRVAVATRLAHLVRFTPDEPLIDPFAYAVWTTGFGFFPDNRSFLRDTVVVPRGHAAVADGAIRLVRYWDPRPDRLDKPTEDSAREHAERLRALLLSTLARDLDPEGGNLLTLSGGVDSSSLAALSAGTLHMPVSSLSFVPTDGPDLDLALSYIDPLVERFGFARAWRVPLPHSKRIELLSEAPPAVVPVVHPALCSLPGICREAPVHVLFGGEFADEACGSSHTFPDWARETSPLDLFRVTRLPSGPKDVLRWAKRRMLPRRMPFPQDLPDYTHPDLREEYREWRDRRQRAAARDQRPRGYLELRAELDGWVAMNWEALSALGVRRSIPFHTREVMELAFECHPHELVGPGVKRLLRRALADDVPARHLHRPDKGIWRDAPEPEPSTDDLSLPGALRAVLRPGWPAPGEPVPAMAAFHVIALRVAGEALEWHQSGRAREIGDSSALT